jgi:hypothetical protein
MTQFKASRRKFIHLAGIVGSTALLAACAPAAVQATATAIPATQAPPTASPTLLASATAVPATQAPPTAIPATLVPPTTVPPTATPPRDRPIDALVASYLAAWSEPDGDKRLPLLEKIMEADATYADANGTKVSDRLSHNQQITEGHVANPGSTFQVTGETLFIPGHVIFSWLLIFGDGSVLEGTAYGELSPDARLSKVVFFF